VPIVVDLCHRFLTVRLKGCPSVSHDILYGDLLQIAEIRHAKVLAAAEPPRKRSVRRGVLLK
jgi:hypothetical protein